MIFLNQNEDKKIIKITDEMQESRIKVRSISQEQLQREFDYIQSEKILNKMLEKGLITEAEFSKITKLNRQTFSPFLAEIML